MRATGFKKVNVYWSNCFACVRVCVYTRCAKGQTPRPIHPPTHYPCSLPHRHRTYLAPVDDVLPPERELQVFVVGSLGAAPVVSARRPGARVLVILRGGPEGVLGDGLFGLLGWGVVGRCGSGAYVGGALGLVAYAIVDPPKVDALREACRCCCGGVWGGGIGGVI